MIGKSWYTLGEPESKTRIIDCFGFILEQAKSSECMRTLGEVLGEEKCGLHGDLARLAEFLGTAEAEKSLESLPLCPGVVGKSDQETLARFLRLVEYRMETSAILQGDGGSLELAVAGLLDCGKDELSDWRVDRAFRELLEGAEGEGPGSAEGRREACRAGRDQILQAVRAEGRLAGFKSFLDKEAQKQMIAHHTEEHEESQAFEVLLAAHQAARRATLLDQGLDALLTANSKEIRRLRENFSFERFTFLNNSSLGLYNISINYRYSKRQDFQVQIVMKDKEGRRSQEDAMCAAIYHFELLEKGFPAVKRVAAEYQYVSLMELIGECAKKFRIENYQDNSYVGVYWDNSTNTYALLQPEMKISNCFQFDNGPLLIFSSPDDVDQLRNESTVKILFATNSNPLSVTGNKSFELFMDRTASKTLGDLVRQILSNLYCKAVSEADLLRSLIFTGRGQLSKQETEELRADLAQQGFTLETPLSAVAEYVQSKHPAVPGRPSVSFIAYADEWLVPNLRESRVRFLPAYDQDGPINLNSNPSELFNYLLAATEETKLKVAPPLQLPAKHSFIGDPVGYYLPRWTLLAVEKVRAILKFDDCLHFEFFKQRLEGLENLHIATEYHLLGGIFRVKGVLYPFSYTRATGKFLLGGGAFPDFSLETYRESLEYLIYEQYDDHDDQ